MIDAWGRREARRAARRFLRSKGVSTMTMERQHRLFQLRCFRLLRLIAREAGWTRERCEWLAAKLRRDHV